MQVVFFANLLPFFVSKKLKYVKNKDFSFWLIRNNDLKIKFYKNLNHMIKINTKYKTNFLVLYLAV